MALTDTALKALKPRLKAYVVSDDRSLYAEVLPTGAIVWRFVTVRASHLACLRGQDCRWIRRPKQVAANNAA